MCLIIICKPGAEKNPSTSTFLKKSIKNAYTHNKDGWGFAYAFKNKIRVLKSLGDDEELISSLSSTDIPIESTLIIHLRNSSAGSINILNTHPFILSEDDNEITAESIITKKPVLFHNGTFYMYKNFNEPGFSDTYRFAKEFMRIPELITLLKRDEKLFEEIFTNKISTNKICVLYNDGEFRGVGTFLKPSEPDYKEHYLFSNTYYLDPPKSTNFNNRFTKYNNQTKQWEDSRLLSNTHAAEFINDDDDPFSVHIEEQFGSSGGTTPMGFSVKPKNRTLGPTNLANGLSPVSSSDKYNNLHDIPIKVTKNNINELYLILKKPFLKMSTAYVYYITSLNDDIMTVHPINDTGHNHIVPTDKILSQSTIGVRKEYTSKYIDYRRLKRDLSPSKNNVRKIASLLKRAFEKNMERIIIKKKGQFRLDSTALYYEEFKHLLSSKDINIHLPAILEP